ncbi:MAG: hypothetical protein D6835_04515 [Candidatus Thermofonsia bacterium]|nr:MAG: hypothetical protein D6835_04515 [Candidatus Thermofonsia bacterium]
MKKVKRATLIIVSGFLLFILFFAVQKSQNPECKSPLILGYMRNHNQPEAIVSRLISELGGLPKVDIDVYEVQNLVDAGGMPPVYSVNEWAIETASVTNSSFSTIFDDDPHI